MSLLQSLLDFVLHLDKNLLFVVQTYGTWAYGIVFTIIFLETALVLTPFLPGDSLIFASGALAGVGSWNVWVLFALLSFAAVLGDTVNYWIGSYVGPKVLTGRVKYLNKEYMKRTHKFFQKYGGKTII